MSNSLDRQKFDAEIAAAFAQLGTSFQELEPGLKPRRTAVRPSARETQASPVIADVRRKAAVLGWFEPQRLINLNKIKGADRRLREVVLSDLVGDCEVQPGAGRPVWRLRREPRREVLAALAGDPATMVQTLRETKVEAKGAETRLFRRILSGKSVNLQRAREDRASLLQVAEWTAGIFKNAPDPSEVRDLLARDAIKESFNVLLPDFRGRRAELGKLRRFVSAASGSDGRLPILGLSGIGGVGKSTLLARFAHGLLERSPRPAVVIIDFDRARFASGDPAALTFELTRQIGAWFPAIATRLRELRHNARINLLSSGFASPDQQGTASLEGVARSTSELAYLLPGILSQAEIGVHGGKPLVIILDTFEVLQGGRGDGAPSSGYRGAQAVAAWAEDLFSTCNLPELRVVVAGRAPIGEDPSFGPRLTEPELRLTGLDEPSALALLRDLGLRAEQARAIVGAVGDPHDGSCNPLVLRLASRLVKAGTIRPETLAKEAGGDHGALDQELVQGILYRRILAHIGDREKDKALAALAHPGLVLRRVTPDLIEQVLFPILDVKERGPGRARELFQRLRREVWLVQEAGPDTVVHRADLRRTMLRLIDADMRQTARKIHRAASRYYVAHASGPDAQLAAGEAFYHRLMLMSRPQAGRLDPAEVRRFESSLHPTLDDLPPHVLAVVKSILDRPLSDEEGKSLPEPRRTEFILRQGERYLLNDEPERALRLLEAKPDLHPLWELRALAVTARWSEAKKRSLLGSEAFRPKHFAEAESLGEYLERMNLMTWICFCLGDSRRAFEYSSRFLADTQVGYWQKLATGYLEQLARWISYLRIAAMDVMREMRKPLAIPPRLQPLESPWPRAGDERLGMTSIALEMTRHAVLRIGYKDGEPAVIFSGEALPPSVRLLRQLADAGLPPELRSKLLGLKRRLQDLPKRASSGYILGTIARGFPKAVIVSPPYRYEGKLLSSLVLPNPEFRGPVKFALLDAFRTQKELALVAELAFDLVDLRPYDLQPEVFAKAAARPGKAGSEIANLVLYLDRSAALGQFLQGVSREKPWAARLAMVASAFQRWERAFQPGSGAA
ncbi:MAG: hypothetical protein QOF89_2600 [Acidobacteriota bacterium]|jgi:hypothetical protein|nr:hypothetical protein [Acidobacteriota bacterium]